MHWLRMSTAIGIVVGSLVLWLGIPAAWVWIGTSVAEDRATGYGIALVGAAPSMAVWGWALYRLQLHHNRLTGIPQSEGQHAGWLRSLSAGRDEGGNTSLLERSLVLSAIAAGVAFALWLVFGPPAPWPSL